METNDLIESVKALINRNTELLIECNELKSYNQKLRLRESLYQGELQRTKNALEKLYKSITPTPHSENVEYQAQYYNECLQNTTEETNEEVS